MKQTCIWLIGLSMSLASVAASAAGPLDSLQPGHWYEVPNSRLESVAPTPFDSKVRNVIEAWSGAAYDTSRDRLIVWGGGHDDYWGNEIYVFDVNQLEWERLNDPYWPARDMGWGEVEGMHADGSPSSRHTYDGLEYLPDQDRFWIMGGSRWRSGSGDQLTAFFNFDNLQWTRRADANVSGTIGVASAYDPVTGLVFLHGGGTFRSYDPATNTWRTLRQDSSPEGQVGEIDPVRRKFVLIGKGSAYVYDISNLNNVTRSNLNASGDRSMESEVPGLAYDPNTGLIVAWDGGSSVYTLNLSGSTPAWSRVTPASGNAVTPSSGANWGTYGRWRYIPSKGVFIGVNSASGNVYFYRLSEDAGSGGATPPPEPLPTVNISASPASIAAGESSLITWTTSAADSCSASGAWSGSRPLSGSFDTGPLSQDSTYSLRCTGAGGTRERSVTVDVSGSGGDGDGDGGAQVGGESADLIEGLTVQDGANAPDWAIRTDFQVGDVIHGDRPFEATAVPVAMLGADWVQTANDSKGHGGPVLATFTVREDAAVHVVHRDDIVNKPAWLLDGWTDSGLDIVNNEGESKRYSLYRRTFTAGTTVQLGPNGDENSGMYIVIVTPAGPDATNPGGGDGGDDDIVVTPPPQPLLFPAGIQPAGEFLVEAPYAVGIAELLGMDVEIVRSSDGVVAFRRVIEGSDQVRVPAGILVPGESVSIRVRHRNSAGWSEWSDTLVFQVSALDAGDLNGDGVDDRYFADPQLEDRTCNLLHPSGGIVELVSTAPGSRIHCLGIVEPAVLGLSTAEVPYGLIRFRLEQLPANPGNPVAASVVINLPQSLADGDRWYRVDEIAGDAHDFTARVQNLGAGSRQVIMNLRDGDDGDIDSAVNGRIVALSGLVTSGGAEQIVSGTASGGTNGSLSVTGGVGAYGVIELLAGFIAILWFSMRAAARRTGRALLPVSAVLLSVVSFQGFAASAPNLPPGTFVAVPGPAVGAGIGDSGAGIKHVRAAFNSDDGRIYFLGGDYQGTGFDDSGRNEIWSYDIATDDWRLEQAYCRPDGGLQADRPDEVGWSYDTRRGVFWMTPGYMTVQGSADLCPGGNFTRQVAFFDPGTGDWGGPFANSPRGTQPDIRQFSQYDPVTDRIIRFDWGGSGAAVEFYDIATNSWNGHTLSGAANNANRIDKGYTAIDPEGRDIYAYSGPVGKLYIYDMDTEQVRRVIDLPAGFGTVGEGGLHPIWDSINQVLLVFKSAPTSNTTLYAYDPADDQWTPLPISQPDGHTVYGNIFIYDPVNNATLVMGGYPTGGNPRMFLYRYGNGDGSAPAPGAPLPTVSLSASSATVTAGGTVQLNWTSGNADSCAASGAWSGARPLSGNEQSAPIAQTSTFTLGCTGEGGVRERSVTVVVDDGGGGGGDDDGGGNPAPPDNEPSALIGNLTVQDGTNAGDWSVRQNLHEGDVMYGDRPYGVTEVPVEVLGADWIRTANDSRSFNGATVATFIAREPIDVYVAHRDDNTPKQAWLGSWEVTGLQIANDEPEDYTLFHRAFAVGETVTLGPNGGGNSSGMYIVLVRTAAQSAPPPAAPAAPALSPIGTGVPVDGLLINAPAGNGVTAAEWEIRSASNAEVYRRVLEDSGDLVVPTAVLGLGQDYQVRLRHQNEHGWSGWSEPRQFRTASTRPGDGDGDGTDDFFQATGQDTDGNGLIDGEEDEICNLRHPSAGVVGIRTTVAGSRAGCRTLVEADVAGLAAQQAPYGFLSFRIEGLPVNSSEVSVVVYLPEPVEAGSRWFKYDETTGGLSDYSNRVSGLTAGSRQVVIRLVDGGDGDADGVMNGVIVDPGGLVTANGAQGITSGGGSAGGADDAGTGIGSFGPLENLLAVLCALALASRIRSGRNAARVS